ncbi:MAG: hypothetical protein IKZ87_01550 [Actinomycetaceae bacterium]|nr:hypothetical protein [Actinomycetaceae bacterium]
MNTLSSALMTAWIMYGLPMVEVTPEQPPGMSDLTKIMGWAMFIGGVICVVAVIAIGASIAIRARHGDGMEAASSLIWVIIGMAIIGSAGTIVGSFIVF